MRRGAWLVGLTFGLWAALGAGTALAHDWSISASENPHGGLSSQLMGVSCTSPTACVAVGSKAEHSGSRAVLIERWNGTRWTLMASPRRTGATASELNGVSCLSAAHCAAVGDYTDGSGVQRTLIERLNQSTWRIQRSPNLSDGSSGTSILYGVSCVGPSACIAVGGPSQFFGGTIALRWNGHRWQLLSTPPTEIVPGAFDGVSCTSESFCVASGAAETALAETWGSGGWSIQSTPAGAPSGLLGTVCASPSACEAVGYQIAGPSEFAIAEGWDGTQWTDQPSAADPNASVDQLNGVGCGSLPASSPGGCEAVGWAIAPGFGENAPPQLPLAEGFDGSNWSVQATPAPAGTTAATLNGVSCAGDACMAVGSWSDSSGKMRTLAERH